jgi:glycosyltransferase involved in cell wall biosynthesis
VRILLAAHGYPPTHTAGAERQTERMAHWLQANGHEVEVFALDKLHASRTTLDSAQHEGVLVHRLSFQLKEVHSEVLRRYDHPRIGAAMRSLLEERPPFDVVHVISGYWIGHQVIREARAHGVPVVVSLMEYWFMCAQVNLIQPTGALCTGPESDRKCTRCVLEMSRRYRVPAQVAPRLMDAAWKAIRWLPSVRDVHDHIRARREGLRDTLTQADQVVCNSRFIIQKFSEAGFDTSRFLFIRQGLPARDVPSHQPRASRPALLRLGYLGQIKFHKGVDLLVNAVVSLLLAGVPVSLDLWGAENEERTFVERLKALAAAFPAIRWRGLYTGNDVHAVLSELDVVVVPSRWYENSPNVILEAYERGLPVVATRLGGMAELVEHERTGLVFTLDDEHDLRAQLERLHTERGLYEHLRSNLPAVRTVDHEMHELIAVYRRLLAPTSPADRSPAPDSIRA